MEKFGLYHLALYAKGWYKRDKKKTIWDDLKVIMSLDGYNGEFMTKEDIVNVTLTHCQRLDVRAFNDLAVFVSGTMPSQSWKYGYYTNTCTWVKDYKNLPNHDYLEGVIRYCLSSLVCTEVKKLNPDGKLPMPDYVKGLPRKNGITNKKLKELFT